jgi:hypothetical protein
MGKVILAAAAVAVLAMPAAGRGVHVGGHVTRSGTYVAPHMRTEPNRTKFDNYSSKPNVNPYTGKAGTVDPFRPGR